MSRIERAWNSPMFFGIASVGIAVFDAVAAIGWPTGVSVRAFGLMLLFAIVLGVRAFYLERKLHNDAKAALRPRLKLVFAKGQIFDSLHDEGRLRIFRVGVLNTGEEPVMNVAVKLARVFPELPRVFPMQEFQQTHKEEGVSRFTVSKSDEPLVFVDVVHQYLYSADGVSSGTIGHESWSMSHKKGETFHMGFAFANGERDFKAPSAHPTERYSEHYFIWLVIEGVGAEAMRKFVLRLNTDGHFDFSEAFA